ncbi:MAG: Hsp70 family protein, partial [Planctomycetales bacterium]|nr:Hsp70 family protein [Planctomycetales bacterium]
DNMDLTLAHRVAELFSAQGVKLDAWQSVALWHACREAKEVLLATDAPESHRVSVLGRGSKLIGGTVSVDVPRQMASDLLVGGFFPACTLGDKPQRRRASGFQEIGLPFESDVAITRHLAAFLTAHAGDAGEAAYPTHLLFNGGVFKADALRSLVLGALRDWSPGGHAVRELPGQRDLAYAVARGAAYYGWTKHRGGMRIRGGTARSYYVGVETAGLAIPGAPRPLRALCVVPFGMEEGTEAEVPSGDIGLVLGEPAHFRFFSSAVRPQDRPGDMLPQIDEEQLAETDSLETSLETDADSEETYVPVRFLSRITELGVFELWCVSTTSDRRWKLEFSIREDSSDETHA